MSSSLSLAQYSSCCFCAVHYRNALEFAQLLIPKANFWSSLGNLSHCLGFWVPQPMCLPTLFLFLALSIMHPLFSATQKLCAVLVCGPQEMWARQGAGFRRGSGLEDLWTRAISSLDPGPHVWEQGPQLCRSDGDSRPPGECTDPWQKGHAAPQTAPELRKNPEIRAAICSGVSSPPGTPHTTHGFRKGSFGKHLKTYGSFLSQDFFNSLCFLLFFFLREEFDGGFRGDVLVWFVLLRGGAGSCCKKKTWMGKKKNRKRGGGLRGGIKSAAKLPRSSLFPTHVPYTEIKRTNTPLFLMMALPSIIN